MAKCISRLAMTYAAVTEAVERFVRNNRDELPKDMSVIIYGAMSQVCK
jgi:hypothetical protein